jgi:hypothetical protein
MSANLSKKDSMELHIDNQLDKQKERWVKEGIKRFVMCKHF